MKPPAKKVGPRPVDPAEAFLEGAREVAERFAPLLKALERY